MEHLVFLEENMDLSTALMVQYDPLFVFFSIAIAVFASYTTSLAAERISHYKKDPKSIIWIIAGSFTLSVGVWAMHFIGMLGARIPVSVSYDPAITAFSLVPVFLASLLVLSSRLHSESLIIRSIAIGAGIGLMHYIGMMAIHMEANMFHHPVMILVSVIVAIVLAYISLKVKLWASENTHKKLFKHPNLIASIIMGLAISTTHYTGMAAAYFFPVEHIHHIEPGINPTLLAQIVGAVVWLLISLLIFMVFMSRRLDLLDELQKYREHLEELVVDRTSKLQTARDEALQATKTKSEFLANMSHELRTPLNSIIGFSTIVKDGMAGPVNEEQKLQLTMVHNSANHLLSLINDILDLSKVEAGKMDIFKDDMALHATVNEVCQLLQPQISEHNLKLTIDFGNAPELYYTDPKMLRQVLLNLLSNAIKFTRQGGVSVKCQVLDKMLQIKVTDTGIGISETGLQQIFDSFKQLDAGDNRMNEGTGLGLAICREFIELLGGKLSASSKVGVGSTFCIKLPIDDLQSDEFPALAPASVNINHFEADEKLILIVDDEGSARELLNTYLKNEGFSTISCSNGQDALNLAKKYKPFAITLDILMPNIDGWSVLAELKSDPEVEKIPVIMISTLDDQRLGLSLGAVDYIQKPVSADDLIKSLLLLSPQQCHVLIVDDHEEDALLLKKILEPAGYSVTLTNSGGKALEAVESSTPDIILLDLMMPVMSGFEVIKHLRSQNNKHSDIPIIVVSAKNLSISELAYLNDNVTQILLKDKFCRDSMLDQVAVAIRKLSL